MAFRREKKERVVTRAERDLAKEELERLREEVGEDEEGRASDGEVCGTVAADHGPGEGDCGGKFVFLSCLLLVFF